ncbi:MAG: DUF2336 domain-containing protein [Devosiaceae bacterium]|nr:DUF2336 domain-containing protein [Devosiaceae bacterium MH13]
MSLDGSVSWPRGAPLERRLDQADALARCLLRTERGDPTYGALVRTLLLAADDPSPAVRFRVADIFADRRDAPKPVVLQLLEDVPSVAATLFARSPLLRTQHQLDGLGRDDALIAHAIAERLDLADSVVDAIVDQCPSPVVQTLLTNASAPMEAEHIERVLERFGGQADVLACLQACRQLSLGQQCELVAAHATALQGNAFIRALVPDARLQKLSGMSGARAVLRLLDALDEATLWPCMDDLSRRGFLTPAFVLRVAFCGRMALLEAIIGHLTETSPQRVRAAVVNPRPQVAAILLKRCGLSPSVREVLSMALVLARELAAANVDWSDDFFAEALSEVVELRLYHDDLGGLDDGAEPFDDAVASLCQEIAADVLQSAAREESSASTLDTSRPLAITDQTDRLGPVIEFADLADALEDAA